MSQEHESKTPLCDEFDLQPIPHIAGKSPSQICAIGWENKAREIEEKYSDLLEEVAHLRTRDDAKWHKDFGDKQDLLAAHKSELSTLREELQRVKARVAAINGQRNVMANAVNQQNWEMFWNADKLLGELVAGNCDHQLAQDFASLRAQLAAREAGLTELGNELFECKAQLKDADDRLAAREEELRQAREGLGKALEAKRNLLKIEQKARHEEVLELEENFRKAKEYGFRADLEIASLRAALVEAQEESQLISVDCAELKDRLDEARRAPWAREDALVQAQEMCGKYLSVLKRIKGFTKPGTSMADILDEALALTQTPNLYRELTERIKEIEEANERMTRQIKVLVKASEAVAGNPECPEQFSNALYCSVLNAVAIGRKGGE